jgi:hypothetical protein
MKNLYKEPLIYFLLIGGFFFVAFNFVGQSTDSQTIVVDRVSLLRHIQQKTKVINQDTLIRSFDTMPADKRKAWIESYVREEALYREAQALGLDKDDPVIKGRVLQKLEFITQEYSEALLDITDEQIEAYFEQNKKDYYVEPYVTFTHVFFSRDAYGDQLAGQMAAEKLQDLNKNKIPFAEAIQHGDRFPFHVNYVERTPDLIASHFSEEMSQQIFALNPGSANQEAAWHGPFTSKYGVHLVMLSRREDGRFPALAEVVSQVIQDTQNQQIRKSLDDTYQAIIDTYAVEISGDVNFVTENGDQIAVSASN